MVRKCLVFLVIFLVLISPVRAAYDSWADSSGIFTVGKPHRVNIYVYNENDPGENDYDINLDPSDICATRITSCDSNHLIRVSLESDRLVGLEPGETGYTIVTVTALGPFKSVNIKFDVGPNPANAVEINFVSANPVSMPEFGLIGLIGLVVLGPLILIISNRFFFRF